MLYNIIKNGSHIDEHLLYDSSIKLQKKQKKGGQSAPRFERIRQGKEHEYIKKVSEKMVDVYTINKTEINVKGVVVAGPAEMKNKLVEYSETKKIFGEKILKIINTSELDDTSIWDVYEKCLDILITKEEENSISLIAKIKCMMEMADLRLIYGHSEADVALEQCMLETLLISSELDEEVKNRFYELNTYGCDIVECNPRNIQSIGIDIIGIKWY